MSEWIPRDILPHILKAVEATDGSVHVFYITGVGGIGKTILLRQVGLHFGSPDGMEPTVAGSVPVWSGLIDLYHSDTNTNSGLEDRLAKALEQGNEFQEYRMERGTYRDQREAGLPGRDLEGERLKLAEVFAQCLNTVTARRRAVVALDTTERIRYEIDTIQELCQLESENATVQAWLLNQLKQWRNCVVLLAGRPESELQQALLEGLRNTSIQYHRVELPGFTEREALDYFSKEEERHPVVGELFDPDLRRRMCEVTAGKPIRLALAIYLAEYELGFDKFAQKLFDDPPEQSQEWIDRVLIKHVMQDKAPIARVLRYLAVARKGLNANLLHHLAGEWSLEDCQRYLDDVSTRAFVKQRPEEERLFLHDEMYELCDKYLLNPPDVQVLSEKVVAWYDQQIRHSKDTEKRQIYEVESVLYRLRANPRQGYYWYAKLADEAIRYAEVGADMQLRNELFAFLKSLSPIDQQLVHDAPNLSKEIECDCASSWVKRFQVWGRFDMVNRVAQTVKAVDNFYPSDMPNSQLSRADLDVYFAQALIYQGRVDEAIDLLKSVIAELETEQKPEELAYQNNPHEFAEGWRRNLVLGRGHNNLGYAHWWTQRHCNLALIEYRAALPYFRASDLLEESANTTDNMGRVYTTLSRRSRAEALIEDSLALRLRLGREYRVALSINSRAIAHLVFDEPDKARQLAEEALEIFERLESRRGVGAASIILGQALRKLGTPSMTGHYSPSVCDEFLRNAMTHLESAIKIYESAVNEPQRLCVGYDEIGCAYRERAALIRTGKSRPSLTKGLVQNAIEWLEKSTAEANKWNYPVFCADAHEDLAQVFFQDGNHKYSQTSLQAAEDQIPDIYKLTPGIAPHDVPLEECIEEFWQILGKIELLRGYLVYDVGASSEGQASRPILENAMEHFVRAYAYFERYSDQAAGLETTLKQLYARFKKCKYDDLRYMQDELLPRIAQSYSLDATSLTRFFRDTLGLAVDQAAG
jgi:tetratricopeptide (TPR) repeat protein